MSENEYGRSRRGGREYRGGRGYRGGGYHGGGSARRDDRSRRDYDDEPRDGILADLVGHLHALDGRSYAAYKATVGRYEAPEGWVLRIDRVQPDPYAPPTRIRLEIPADLPGLEILERSAVVLLPDADPQEDGEDGEQAASAAAWTLEIRARMALPARGRSIQGHEAARIVSRDLTREVGTALDLTGRRAERLTAHVAALEDHRALARAVRENGWVSFLADGAELPRRSGVSDAPMRTGAVPLRAPEPLAAVVELPHTGRVRGTAIGSGVTVIVGGGYHGKSTLLAAIERGVYPHVPGDGRELVATVPDAVKVRATDGRAVTGVDLSPFISHLPGGRDTTAFTTKNASGSTSQAASIIEAIEAGASALLLDEDTSATNLLIRDARMRALVADEREPITPFVDRVGALSASGVSTVMVMGGSGDYLDVADRVVLMDSYALRDATTEAAAVAAAQPRVSTALSQWPTAGARVPLPSPPRDRRGPVRTRSRGLTQVTLDREDIDVADVSGIVDPGQTEAIAHALRALLEQRFDGESSLAQCLEDLDALLDDEGLDALGSAREHPAFLVRPRAVDVAGAVNRYRSLELA